MDNQWIELKSVDTKKLNDAQCMVHHAIQFIGMAGKQLIPQEADDSNTNLEWIPEINSFVGQLLNWNLKLGLSLETFNLNLLNADNEVVRFFPLDSKTPKGVFSWLKIELIMNGVLAQDFEHKLHYEIPPLPDELNNVFHKPDQELLDQLAIHRTNASQALVKYAERFKEASEIRTWPHHFDHGIFVPLVMDENNNPIRSFYMGYSIADEVLMHEPYYYVSPSAKNKEINYDEAPDLVHGEWCLNGYKGAVLPISHILDSDHQDSCLDQFLETALEYTLHPKFKS